MDLISLVHLNEPSILHCLEQRYANNDIYTFSGPILIALNPFKRIPNLYCMNPLDLDLNAENLVPRLGTKSLPAHIYSIAYRAYVNMQANKTNNRHGRQKVETLKTSVPHSSSVSTAGQRQKQNQIILINGESGSGKTESTKYLLRYLTALGSCHQNILHTADHAGTTANIINKILVADPILEAFGNACTVHNKNSSRFGKLISLFFNNRGHVIGANVQVTLLETVRAVRPQKAERNFHIFYQVMYGADVEERCRWGLDTIGRKYYYLGDAFLPGNIDICGYTSSSEADTGHGNPSSHPDIQTDLDGYCQTKRALKTLNFTALEIAEVFDTVAGLLHLGQVHFSADRFSDLCHVFDYGDNNTVGSPTSVASASGGSSLKMAADLLGFPDDALRMALLKKTITAKWETYVILLTCAQAADVRDMVVRTVYNALFQYLLFRINQSVGVDPHRVRAQIGVLDIFGFERFRVNGFEQLCINYANELLQFQFNEFAIRSELEMYITDGIEGWGIEHTSNAQCVELISGRSCSIFAVLDDLCKLSKSTDEQLASHLYKTFALHPHFAASAQQKRSLQFGIVHYAGAVTYDVAGFLTRNRNEVSRECLDLMRKSTRAILSRYCDAPEFIMKAVQETASRSTTAGGGGVAGGAPYMCNPLYAGEGCGGKAADASDGSEGKEKRYPSSLSGSTCSVFRRQLRDLMDTVANAQPHYVRCIKPDPLGRPDHFNVNAVGQQLVNGGVFQAAELSRRGFPVRLLHNQFLSMYGYIAAPAATSLVFKDRRTPSQEGEAGHIGGDCLRGRYELGESERAVCQTLVVRLVKSACISTVGGGNGNGGDCAASLEGVGTGSVTSVAEVYQGNLGAECDLRLSSEEGEEVTPWLQVVLNEALEKESIQVGATKVFLSQRAYDALEQGLSVYRNYAQQYAVRVIQRFCRRFLYLKRLQLRREVWRRHQSVCKIQALVRRRACSLNYANVNKAVRAIQRVYRGHIVRLRLYKGYMCRCAVRLQRLVRGLIVHHRFMALKWAAALLQRRYRYKAEARLRLLILAKKQRVRSMLNIHYCVLCLWHRRRYRRVIASARCIQRLWRGHLERKSRTRLEAEAGPAVVEGSGESLSRLSEMFFPNHVRGVVSTFGVGNCIGCGIEVAVQVGGSPYAQYDTT